METQPGQGDAGSGASQRPKSARDQTAVHSAPTGAEWTRNSVTDSTIDAVVQARRIDAVHIHGHEPTGSSSDAHRQVVAAQTETIRAQRELIALSHQLSEANRRLADSTAARARASQMIFVLQLVLMRLTSLIENLIRERDGHLSRAAHRQAELHRTNMRLSQVESERVRTEGQLEQAYRDHRRATALAAAAHLRVRELEAALAGPPNSGTRTRPDSAEVEPVPVDVDDALDNVGTALDRMEHLLSEQDQQLTGLETALQNDRGSERTDAEIDQSRFARPMIGVALIDHSGVLLRSNQVLRSMLDYSDPELIGRRLSTFMHPADAGHVRAMLADLSRGVCNQSQRRARFIRQDGARLKTTLMILPVRDRSAGITCYRAEVVDETPNRLRPRGSTYRDPMTDLATLKPFLSRLHRAFDQTGDKRPGMLYLDIDEFKLINHAFGHQVGDQVLVTVADRLRAAVGDGGLVARIAADEFAVLIDNSCDGNSVKAVAHEAVRSINLPVEIDGVVATPSASVGVAECRVDAGTADDLMRDAQIACHRAKAGGGNRFVVHEDRRHN